MSTSALETGAAGATAVTVTADTLTVELSDGRAVSVPLAWFPRLVHGSTAERANCRVVGRGGGVHWPDLDEDVSVEGLLAGRPSAESQASLRRWLAGRAVPPVAGTG